MRLGYFATAALIALAASGEYSLAGPDEDATVRALEERRQKMIEECETDRKAAAYLSQLER